MARALLNKLFDEHDGSKSYKPQNYDAGGVWNGEFTTIAGLQEYMKKNDIPETAWIRYAGCGSHMIEFFWPDPNSEDDEDWRN